MKAPRITESMVKVTVKPLDEDCHWTDPSNMHDDEVNAIFAEMVDNYGLWGWCTVRVRASLGMLYGDTYLGGCSYKDEADFRVGGYLPQMIEEAISELQGELDDLFLLLYPE